MKTTIAIKNEAQKAFAIEADLIEIHGISCGVHRSINNTGWAVTVVGVGIALAVFTGQTKQYVINLATERVERAGVESVKAKIAALPLAPAVETLPKWQAPVKEAPTISPGAVCIAIAERSGVAVEIIERIICKRGKNIGRLISKCPSVFGPDADKVAAAVWLGIQPNPYKVSPGKVLFLDKENQELCLRLGKIKWPAWLDSDRAALESFGVW